MGEWDWPYKTANPNKSELEIDGEASIAYARLRKGEKAEDIAADLKIGRATFYRRVARFASMHDQPTQTLRRLLAESELERLTDRAIEALNSATSADSIVKVIAELRMINQSRRKLYGVDEVPAAAPVAEPEVDEEPDQWVAGARADADAELDAAERELRTRRNGAPS